MLLRGPPWHILGLVISCEIHFLPAPAHCQVADTGVMGCSNVRSFFSTDSVLQAPKYPPGLRVDPFLHLQDPTSSQQSPIGFKDWLNSANAIKSLAAFTLRVSRINQFLRAGYALKHRFSKQQSEQESGTPAAPLALVSLAAEFEAPWTLALHSRGTRAGQGFLFLASYVLVFSFFLVSSTCGQDTGCFGAYRRETDGSAHGLYHHRQAWTVN